MTIFFKDFCELNVGAKIGNCLFVFMPAFSQGKGVNAFEKSE
jgi:hypothetical protein